MLNITFMESSSNNTELGKSEIIEFIKWNLQQDSTCKPLFGSKRQKTTILVVSEFFQNHRYLHLIAPEFQALPGMHYPRWIVFHAVQMENHFSPVGVVATDP